MHFSKLLALAMTVKAMDNAHLFPREEQALAHRLGERSLVDNIIKDIEQTATCAACKTALGLLKGITFFGDQAFVNIIQGVCRTFSHEDDDVCDGSLASEGPIMAKSIRTMSLSSDTSDIFCASFLGLCDYPDVHEWEVPMPSKTATSKAKRAPYWPEKRATATAATAATNSTKTPLKIVQYSDIHVDQRYEAGSSTNCTKPICCHAYTDADKPGVSTSPAGINGNHNCDSPKTLEEAMYAAIQEYAPDAAFAIFTGDIIDHGVWMTTEEHNKAGIDDAYETMAGAIPLVYGTYGNHESTPPNAYQPNDYGNQAEWIYDVVSSQWTRWLGNATVETATAASMGAYSKLVPGHNVRIISLNTNMYYIQNYYLYHDPMVQDPNGQIAWLVSELAGAETNGEKVYIIGHTPPGDSDAFHDQSNYLNQVIARYNETIAGMFFGHTHVDQFEIAYSDYDNRNAQTAMAMAYVCPALVPSSGMPSFRIYEVDPDTYQVLDAITYAADMTDPSFQSTSGPKFTKFYSARETYGPLVAHPPAADAPLNAAFWHEVTDVLEDDDNEYKKFVARKSRGWDSGAEIPDKESEICQLRAARSQDNCFEPTPGLAFRKREDTHTHDGTADCGVSLLRTLISNAFKTKDALHFLQDQWTAIAGDNSTAAEFMKNITAQATSVTNSSSVASSGEAKLI